MLAIHGITGHGRRFRRLAEEAWPERRTVAVDLRGHGRSTYDGPWSVGQHVTDVADTLDSLGLETTDVVGHSYGGMIGLHLLARSPGRIARLAMLDPAFARAGESMNLMAAAEMANPGFASYEEALAAEHAGYPDHVIPAAIENVDEHLVRGDDGRYRFRYHRPAVIAGWGELCSPVPAIAEQRPALLVVADRAGLVTAPIIDTVRAELGDQLSVVHVDSGHTLDWERFDETAAAIHRFWASTGS
ncbi:MAG: alpha/beta hydrolase fold protein [Ilumatobacteraceae bacterium]|nr:alpha/beta hydrolase fold protein [Ilumatobacteraceae bacterium]